jgi:FKBP-type peptidyl-prolyl cis-trans isomerase
MTDPRAKVFLAAILALAPGAAAAGAEPAPGGPTPVNPATAPAPKAVPPIPLSAFAAIGSSFALDNHLTELGWSDAEVSAFIDGIRAAFKGKAYPFDEAARQASAEMGRRLQEMQAPGHPPSVSPAPVSQASFSPAQVKQYMKDISKRLALEETESGLCYAIQTPGKGSRPGPNDTVIMSCAALAADGSTKLPQLSTERARIKVSDLLPGIAEGIQLTANTGQAYLVVPPALSFGQGEWPEGVARGSPIIFLITLHEVVNPNRKP